MPGALWSVWRSVRGIEMTDRLVERARWSRHGAALLWSAHLREGIADDDSPTGIEHAFRLESFQPDLFVLWSRWRDYRGALRLRELGRGKHPEPLVAISHEVMLDHHERPVRARAFDLGVLHELAREATDVDTLAEAWRSNLRCDEIEMPRCFPGECHVSPYAGELSEQVAAQRASCAGHERELLEQIEAAPHETGPLLVYADWLETSAPRRSGGGARPPAVSRVSGDGEVSWDQSWPM